MKKPMIGMVQVTETIRPGVVAFTPGHGNWANGATDVTIDGMLVKGDPRRGGGLNANAAIWQSNADFFDLHLFFGLRYTLENYILKFGTLGLNDKPIIIGQLAAAKQGYPTAAKAAQALVDVQVDSCFYGFDGWILWLYGSEADTALWNGPTDGGAINDALAPANRPDPCRSD